ncbi:hypothetical protein [Treponema sp.]|uniref:hypothetical protein n=1 Tax=Treponema sp. TaxID=166 RepID=UPI00298E11FA|nr:hypothetical protein [Treponema sp.]MCR5613776.1 hypothetical protein [Treponema sp.]
MKKIITILLISISTICSIFAQALNADAIASDMVLPDGATATIALYKKWGPANKDIQTIQPKDKKPMVGTTMTIAKTESDIGYFRKTYNGNETEDIAALCEVMKYCGAMYGVTWLDYGNRVTRCVFTYKGGKLTYDRMDFFDETNGDYADFVAKENAKRAKRNKIAGDLTKIFLKPISNISEAANTNETPQQTLHRLRHQTSQVIRNNGDEIQVFSWRYIYHDDGRIVHGYIVDLDGNIHDEITWEIPPKYSVSKDIRDLALKSLE